jgi:hypothetical protein
MTNVPFEKVHDVIIDFMKNDKNFKKKIMIRRNGGELLEDMMSENEKFEILKQGNYSIHFSDEV